MFFNRLVVLVKETGAVQQKVEFSTTFGKKECFSGNFSFSRTQRYDTSTLKSKFASIYVQNYPTFTAIRITVTSLCKNLISCVVVRDYETINRQETLVQFNSLMQHFESWTWLNDSLPRDNVYSDFWSVLECSTFHPLKHFKNLNMLWLYPDL